MSLKNFRSVASAATLLALAVIAACSDAGPSGPKPVASVTVSPASRSIMVGEQISLQARPKAMDGEELERDIAWASENEILATVSSTGVVTAHAVGQVGIRATSEGRFGRAVITVEPAPVVPAASVRLSVTEEIVLAWDGQKTISAEVLDADGNVLQNRPILWRSSRPSVAMVVNDGNITAQSAGTATITATTDGEISASIAVRVLEAPAVAIAIEAVTTGLERHDVMPFAAKITFANGLVLYGPATWTSSNSDILKVQSVDLTSAAIAALGTGEATITATRDGVSASMTLSVTERPTYDLIYNRWNGDESEIFVLPLLSDGLVPMKLNAGNVSREPSPSPDGTRFVFAVSQTLPTGESQHDLFIVNRDGMNMKWLTRTAGFESQPQWSPTAPKIVFTGVANGRSDLYVIDTSGAGTTNLTAAFAQFTAARHPAWSPDGSKIAFIGVRDGRHKVWVMNADGTGLTQVTTDAGYDEFPAFSPDGQKLAFTRFNDATPTLGDDLMIVSAQGGTPTRIALPAHQRRPAWSPDGLVIAMQGNAIGAPQTEIYTIRPDGTGLRLRTVNPAFGGGFNPAWIKRND